MENMLKIIELDMSLKQEMFEFEMISINDYEKYLKHRELVLKQLYEYAKQEFMTVYDLTEEN